MKKIISTKVQTTILQEQVLIELNKTGNHAFICKKLNIKFITLQKIIRSLIYKGLLDNNQNLTINGKETINYYNFKNNTINQFLKSVNLENNTNLKQLLSKLDFETIITIRNILTD